MPEGQVLEFSHLTKRFGSVRAVSDLTARVEPGAVTGFLGPNGAGKTTTLRMLLGLVRPTSGTATIGGAPYAKLKKPLQTVGAVLEASSFHPGRTGANHLKIYAQAAGLPRARVDETLGLVGLADAAGRKVGGYSLGMRQRLGLAYALLGDPGVLVLDEPANGLDPEGIKWLRGFLQQLAREGRTVLVSSHLLTEVQQTADAVLILADGRRVFNGSISDLVDPAEQVTIVDSGDRAGLVAALREAGIASEVLRSGVTVRTADPAEVGRAAAAAGIALTALQRRGPALEEVFLELVSGARVHPSADAGYDEGGRTSAAAPGAGAVAGAAVVAAAAAGEAAPADAAATEAAPAADATAAEEPVITGGVVVAPTIAAAAETRDEDTEFDAPAPAEGAAVAEVAEGPVDSAVARAAEPGDEAIDDAAAEPATAEPEPAAESRPAFAVAGTGVIDIVPTPVPTPDADAADDVEAADEPAEAPVDSAEARAAEPGDQAVDEPAAEQTDAGTAPASSDSEPAAEPDDAAASESGDTQDGEPERSEGADDDEPDDDDYFEEDDDLSDDVESAYVTHSAHAGEDERTESDLAADAFFAAFDHGDGSTAPDGAAAAPEGAAAEPEGAIAEAGAADTPPAVADSEPEAADAQPEAAGEDTAPEEAGQDAASGDAAPGDNPDEAHQHEEHEEGAER